MIRNLIEKTRSIRRFRGDKPLKESHLVEIVDLGRLGGSARNNQPLKYMVITDIGLRRQIFTLLGWAGYLKDWPGPAEHERPQAYIICLLDKRLCRDFEHEADFDLGIASQNMLLGAAEKGIAGCRIGSFSPEIGDVVELSPDYKVLLVIALGYPAEQVVLEEVGPDDAIRYWRDDNNIHHVPKRPLAKILISINLKPFVH